MRKLLIVGAIIMFTTQYVPAFDGRPAEPREQSAEERLRDVIAGFAGSERERVGSWTSYSSASHP